MQLCRTYWQMGKVLTRRCSASKAAVVKVDPIYRVSTNQGDQRYVDLATIPDEMREEQSREQAKAPTMTGASVHMSLTSFAQQLQLSPAAIPSMASKTSAGALLQPRETCLPGRMPCPGRQDT